MLVSPYRRLRYLSIKTEISTMKDCIQIVETWRRRRRRRLNQTAKLDGERDEENIWKKEKDIFSMNNSLRLPCTSYDCTILRTPLPCTFSSFPHTRLSVWYPVEKSRTKETRKKRPEFNVVAVEVYVHIEQKKERKKLPAASCMQKKTRKDTIELPYLFSIYICVHTYFFIPLHTQMYRYTRLLSSLLFPTVRYADAQTHI